MYGSAAHPISDDLLLQALQPELPHRFGGDGAGEEAVGLGAEDDLPRAGDLGLQAGCHVDDVAEHGVVDAAMAADVADHHRAAVDAYPGLEGGEALRRPAGAPGGEPALDLDRGGDGAASVIGLRDGGAEESHDAVADELVEGAAGGEDRLHGE